MSCKGAQYTPGFAAKSVGNFLSGSSTEDASLLKIKQIIQYMADNPQTYHLLFWEGELLPDCQKYVFISVYENESTMLSHKQIKEEALSIYPEMLRQAKEGFKPDVWRNKTPTQKTDIIMKNMYATKLLNPYDIEGISNVSNYVLKQMYTECTQDLRHNFSISQSFVEAIHSAHVIFRPKL